MTPEPMRLLLAAAGLSALSLACQTVPPDKEKASTASTPLRLTVRYTDGLAPGPLDGRLLVVISPKATPEPRMQVQLEDNTDATPEVFGLNVDGWAAGTDAVVGPDVLGYPIASLTALPPGDYWVQAVLHRYETFKRGDGVTLKLPPDRGEGQHWNEAPGNLISTPVRVHLDPKAAGTVALTPGPRATAPPRTARHPILEARALPKRAAVALLGPGHVRQRAGAVARGLGEPPHARITRSSSTTRISRPTCRATAESRPSRSCRRWTWPDWPSTAPTATRTANPTATSA